MIFGGLEIVAGGYFAHKYYKNKNEKKRLVEEAQARRHHTFPGNKSASCPSQPRPPQPRPTQSHSWTPQPVAPQQKYPYYASVAPQPQPQPQTRPNPVHTQSFTIPRRPVPQRKPAIIIQPSLQRADSMATLSRMPIANGSRPQGLPVEQAPVLPPRRQATGLSPVSHSPYANPSFSVSSPAFGATPTSPPITYVMGTEDGIGGRQTIDDNWETYNYTGRQAQYAPTEASTQLGEHDPPPPYVP